jgi:hypothetical protein
MLAAVAPLTPAWVDAFPLQRAPTTHTSASPSATPYHPPNVLPFGTVVPFVLDGTIGSGTSRAGEMVAAHLENDLVVDGTTIAKAGAPVEIKIIDALPASNPDLYGFVDIHFRPLALENGAFLPVRAPAEHLNVNTTAGHDSTVAVENTIGDIFEPTLIYHVFRKGRNFTLTPGAHINAITEATIRVTGGTVAIETPQPLVLDAETPVSSFRAMPLATPDSSYKPRYTPPPASPASPNPANPVPMES